MRGWRAKKPSGGVGGLSRRVGSLGNVLMQPMGMNRRDVVWGGGRGKFRLPMLASERCQVSVEHGDKERVLSAVFGGGGGEESDRGDEIDGGGKQISVLSRETRGDPS